MLTIFDGRQMKRTCLQSRRFAVWAKLRPSSSMSTSLEHRFGRAISPFHLSRFMRRPKKGLFTALSEEFSFLQILASLNIIPNRLGELFMPQNPEPVTMTTVNEKDTLATFVFRYRPRGKHSNAIVLTVQLTSLLEPYCKPTE